MNPSSTATPDRVVPLLMALSRIEGLTSTLAMRLDCVTVHEPVPSNEKLASAPQTVTRRIDAVGDALQYLLDHIEL